MRICIGENGKPRAHVEIELVSIFMCSDKETVRVYGQKNWETRADLVAERRPDGKWYLSREWDAKGYDTLYVNQGDG